MKQLQQIAIMLSALFLLSGNAAAAVHDLGTFGMTYPIAEKDAIEEIKEKADKTDWSKHFNKEKIEKAVKEYRPENIARLPRAAEDRTFQVDMSYTLDFDIPDGKGGILYPKGYTFNPLDYVQWPNVMVVIDGSDKDQVRWLTSSQYLTDYRTMLLISDGGFWDLSHSLKRPVFYATQQIAERFQLKAVPSVIRQSGRYMEIKEIEINSKDKKSRSDPDISPVSVSVK
jgi:conjugal transfer pilus assembly protein TraW